MFLQRYHSSRHGPSNGITAALRKCKWRMQINARGENAVTSIVSLSTHPRALLAATASFTLNEHPPPRDVCFSIKPAGKCAPSLIHRGSFSQERERARKRKRERNKKSERGGEAGGKSGRY